MNGSFKLRPPRRNAVMLAFLALGPAVVLGLLTLQAWQAGGTGLSIAIVASLLAFAVPAYLVASAVRSHVVVRDTGMERVGVFRRRLVGWAAVTALDFNPSQHWFFLTMSDRSHLWLRADSAGIGDFAAIALRRLRPAVLEAADPSIREALEELAETVRREPRGS